MVLDNVPSPILIIGYDRFVAFLTTFISNVILLCRSIICIFGGGLAAGLTIGIMSLDVGMSPYKLSSFLTNAITLTINVYTFNNHITHKMIK